MGPVEYKTPRRGNTRELERGVCVVICIASVVLIK